jgi:homoserine kinase
VSAGALAACWSGAGPSLLAICTVGSAGSLAEAAAELMLRAEVSGRVLQCPADHAGVQVSE